MRETWENNKAFEEAIKNKNYKKVITLLESTDFSKSSLEYGIFLACINDNTRIFKYIIKYLDDEQKWINSYYSAAKAYSSELKTINYIDKKIQLEEINHIKALNQNIRNPAVIDFLSQKIDIKGNLEESQKQYIVNYSYIEIIKHLALNHQIDFSNYLELAKEKSAQYNGDKVLDFIFYQSLDKNLDKKTTLKTRKI